MYKWLVPAKDKREKISQMFGRLLSEKKLFLENKIDKLYEYIFFCEIKLYTHFLILFMHASHFKLTSVLSL